MYLTFCDCTQPTKLSNGQTSKFWFILQVQHPIDELILYQLSYSADHAVGLLLHVMISTVRFSAIINFDSRNIVILVLNAYLTRHDISLSAVIIPTIIDTISYLISHLKCAVNFLCRIYFAEFELNQKTMHLVTFCT